MRSKLVNQPNAVEQSKPTMSVKKFILQYNAPIMLILLIIIAAILSPVFLSKQNIFNVLRQQSTYIIITIGVMLTIMTAGIDLSVSSIAAVGSIMVAMALTNWGLSLPVAILLAIIIGGAIGAINGYLIGYLKMAPFIVTLAVMTAGQGFAYLITKGAPIRLFDTNPASSALISFGQAKDPILGAPLPVYLAAFVAVIFYLIMKYTAFGRLIIATGSNETAVRLAGINVKKYKFWVYVISGGLAAMAGLIITARAATATPITSASDFNLSAIAACVIGGVSLEGGKGTVAFTLVGVFIIALITNIMNLMSIAAYPQLIMKGLIIVFAVLLRSLSERNNK